MCSNSITKGCEKVINSVPSWNLYRNDRLMTSNEILLFRNEICLNLGLLQSYNHYNVSSLDVLIEKSCMFKYNLFTLGFIY